MLSPILSCSTTLILLTTSLLILLFVIHNSSFLDQNQLLILSLSSFGRANNVSFVSTNISTSFRNPNTTTKKYTSTTPKLPSNPNNFSSLASSSTNSTSTVFVERVKKSRIERIEQDLARARSAIRAAIVSKSFKSEKNESFVPRGSVYRNAHAFHQSHIEMVKRFKVWSYREGEQPIFHIGPLNNIYAIEGQFMDEIESPKSIFRAKSPEEAHMFFLPMSLTNVVHYVYKPILSKADYNRDRLYRLVNDYVQVVANKYPHWNTSKGADHFLVSCHDWAPELSDGKPELYTNFIRVLCNANTTEGFIPRRDISLPEINLPFGKLGPPSLGQGPNHRPILAFFAGGVHGYIRHILMKQWKEKDNEVLVYERLNKTQNYTTLMGRSKFCLCPSGYEVASPRIAEAMYANCVPVIISDNYTLPFSDVLDWSQFSVQIPVNKITEIKSILRGISNEEYLKMYKGVSMVKRHFVINRPAKPFDVFHMILHSVWLRRLDFKLRT